MARTELVLAEELRGSDAAFDVAQPCGSERAAGAVLQRAQLIARFVIGRPVVRGVQGETRGAADQRAQIGDTAPKHAGPPGRANEPIDLYSLVVGRTLRP